GAGARAAAWHEGDGFADDAVRHALAAGETGWAARLVERNVGARLQRSEGATLRRWLSALWGASVRARARLCWPRRPPPSSPATWRRSSPCSPASVGGATTPRPAAQA